MNNNYEDRIAYRKGNVIGLNFVPPRYEITDNQKRSEGCEREEPCEVYSLDKFRVERASNNIYVKGLSLEDALKKKSIEQKRSRKGKKANKLVKGLFGKSSISSSSTSSSNIVNLSQRGDKVQREYSLLKELNKARELGMFQGLLHKRDVVDYLTRQLPRHYGFDLKPLSHLQHKELTALGLSLEYYKSSSLESRIDGGMN
ncbi:MAG: hypothetical protein ACMXYB_02550 [Candidatus Woesearchaeota archaeon]